MTVKAKSQGSVSQITSVLEDISIHEDEFRPSSLFELPPCSDDNTGKLSQIDQKTIELLQLLDQYESYLNKQSFNFMNGFLTLSRANYNSGVSKRYGPNSYDYRPYKACKSVQLTAGGNAKLLSSLPVRLAAKMKKSTSYENEKENIDDADRKEDSDTHDRKDSVKSKDSNFRGNDANCKDSAISNDLKRSDNTSLKNRKSKTKTAPTGIIDIHETDGADRIRDPLDQFGALVPYQLLQSQKFFSEGLEQSIMGFNLKAKIDSLIDEIESLKK